ncbi:MAG: DUF2059 domain-containing protein [Alphaproteobacteria bacterium]|nr:DUF2059 domain-containing protein [Alphaproteobacteria bacterium]
MTTCLRRGSSKLRFVVLALSLGVVLASYDRHARAAEPEGKRLAIELLSTMNVAAQFDQIVPVIMQQMSKLLLSVNPSEEVQVTAILNDIAIPDMRARLPEMIDQIADLYVRVFAVDELKELSTFYATTLGRKLISVLPELQKASILIGARWGETVSRDVQARHRETLRQRGIAL